MDLLDLDPADLLNVDPADMPEIDPDDLFLPESLESGTPDNVAGTNPVRQRLDEQLRELTSQLNEKRDEFERLANSNSQIYSSIKNEVLYGSMEPSQYSESMMENPTRNPIVIITDVWKRFIGTKWIIGVDLRNTTEKTIKNMRIDMKSDDDYTQGRSSFWRPKNHVHWVLTSEMSVNEPYAVGTFSSDISDFNDEYEKRFFGVVSYEMDNQQFQVAIPMIRLIAHDTIQNSESYVPMVGQVFNQSYTGLAIKSISVEMFMINTSRKGLHEFSQFLFENSFKHIHEGMFVNRKRGSLVHTYVELFANSRGRVSEIILGARTRVQLTILRRFLVDTFLTRNTSDNETIYLKAANDLMEELNLYVNAGSLYAIHEAQLKTDSLIP